MVWKIENAFKRCLKNGIFVEKFVKILNCIQMQDAFLWWRIDGQRHTSRMSQQGYAEE